MSEYSPLEKIRIQKLEELRAEGIEPYPTRATRTHTSVQAVAEFEAAEKEGRQVEATLAGRIRAVRPMGKLSFAHIEDGEGKVQLFFRVNEIGQDQVDLFNKMFDIGDFIQASGSMIRTKTGEATLLVREFKMLAKAVSPLPAAKDETLEDGTVVRHAALEDAEIRARQRYADLAVNPEVRETFRKRAAIVKALREFLDGKGFLEVETPILQPLYGGAAARPFVTHHNELDQDMYLRISFELYLKRLLVGNLEKVYEIGRDFRNEGVSFKHNPEFTQLEFYWAYADYLQVMELAEQMVSTVAQQVLGTTKIKYKEHEIDLTPPWRRLEMRQGLLDATGVDIYAHVDSDSLAAALRAKGFVPPVGVTRGKLVDWALSEKLEPTLIQPTFLYDYPRDISPLAKSRPGDPLTVERFEVYIAGFELCNAFTELNDPLDQESRFLEMGRDYKSDDEERHPLDEDYLRAMRYGMPPTGGFGMGVDRLVMLLTDKRSIREVLLFPALRKEE
ncbi:MAG: lysine--tRNA ligase [Anaerolineales bacterium]|nr:Lysine--tRNA ligase [Anaerolineales bacterium]MCZ7548785.1 lysine--tRNA ligase [Anaerolineales bacterium]MDX9936313.1 lysine--tRNA ligase [Anaerolineales bacterium]GER80916.1 lysine--tRNA ligase [Candidatus Denitrolinea symbiosum]